MGKLTVSVDDRVIRDAKRYARERGVSLSHVVGAYLSAVTETAGEGEKPTPILNALRGTLTKASVDDYRQHLVAKNITAYDHFMKTGIIGAVKGGRSDLSTNEKYFEGFGKPLKPRR